MVLRDLLGLTNLLRAYTFNIYKLSEVVIVNKIKNFLFAIFQVWMPSIKGLNDGQELLIIGAITSFIRDYFLREKNHQVSGTNFGLRIN